MANAVIIFNNCGERGENGKSDQAFGEPEKVMQLRSVLLPEGFRYEK